MSLTQSSAANASEHVTDSIFTWTFTAISGDSWGGTLVEDETRYVVGSKLITDHGAYTIMAATPQAVDLGEFGFDEGWISVGWYRDSTGAWMLTRLGEATAAGLAGLGSEVDAAWSGTAWDSFGLGGADQANPGDLADSLFTWSFTADSGDVLYGTLLDDTVDWDVGSTLDTAHGTYRILTETPYGTDLGQAGAEGTVTTTRYYDGASKLDFALESGGVGPTGYGGLGSELDRAWTGSAWVMVGQGGALQADRLPDQFFDWTFTANNGDYYSGRMVSHSTAWQVGDTLATAHGSYAIKASAPLGGQIIADGTVWTNGGYYDASAGRLLTSYAASVLGGAPTGNAGLGSELDRAWDGDEWDEFGLGGQRLASVENVSIFQWRFDASNGDSYHGWLVEDRDAYAVDATLPQADGTYTIEAVFAWAGNEAIGTVWTTAYYDTSADTWMPTYYWSGLQGQPSGTAGLGSEYDYAWDGDEWWDFGLAGSNLASVSRNNVFSWHFTASNGDSYNGWLVEDVERYTPGDTVATAHGIFTIDGEHPWAGTQQAGTVWTTAYHDLSANITMTTYFWDARSGEPSGTDGLGSEYDYAWTGSGWVDFGVGGSNLADALGAAQDLLIA